LRAPRWWGCLDVTGARVGRGDEMTKLRLLLGACGVVFLIWVINMVGPSAIFHSLNKVLESSDFAPRAALNLGSLLLIAQGLSGADDSSQEIS